MAKSAAAEREEIIARQIIISRIAIRRQRGNRNLLNGGDSLSNMPNPASAWRPEAASVLSARNLPKYFAASSGDDEHA